MANKKELILKGFADDITSAIKNNKEVLMNAYNEQATQQATQQTVVDPTQQAQATSQADVEAQDARTRLWQSLNQSYDRQREQVDKDYATAISQADRALQSRGMGRSSYAGQTLANMRQEQVKANADVTANQIADYQNRLTQLDQQEKEDERYERQFAYQQERDTIADQQWKQQFDAQQEQWKQQFEYNKMTTEQQVAYNYIMNMLEKGDNPSDALLKQAGISRKDYEQMKTKAKKTTGSGRSSGGGGKTPWEKMGMTEEMFAAYYPEQYKAYKSSLAGTGDTGNGDQGGLFAEEGDRLKKDLGEKSNNTKEQIQTYYEKLKTARNKTMKKN